MSLTNKKGVSVSTKELLFDLQIKLKEADCDPVKELANLAMHPTTPLDNKISILKELAQYIAPKRRAVDVTIDNDSQLTVVIKKFTENPEVVREMMNPEPLAEEIAKNQQEKE